MVRLLQDWITQQADRDPDAIAVVYGEERMSYAQLEDTSNRLAKLLKANGCRRGERICLLMPKSPAAVAGILGIYKSDCILVPLDPSSPPARLVKIIQSAGPCGIIASDPVTPLLDQILEEPALKRSLSIGWLSPQKGRGHNFTAEFSESDFQRLSASPVICRNRSEDPAHILFTSGSTGMPKGVAVTHRSVIHFVQWANRYFGVGASDRLSCHSPLHFDLSTYDLFGAFAAGAQVHLVSPHFNLLPNQLAHFIRKSELTQWFSVPSVLNYMAKFDVVSPHDFPELKRILWCGEVFPTASLMYWMKRLPHVQFTNLYGPTEATIASSFYTVKTCPENETAAIAIGQACDGEELLVLDEHLKPVPTGMAGDLYIRGVGLSPGYWQDPEKTESAFLPNPHSRDPQDRIYKTGDLARIGEDGLIYFIGRRDSQIKSRGYRIELGEIEAALNTIEGVRECAVTAIDAHDFEGSIICCAYSCSHERGVTPNDLRRELSKVLPSYMLPARWLALPKLPANANGKVDRKKIKEEFEKGAAEAA